MNDERLITSDHPLDAGQKAKLTALLDVLIPASEDGRLPSAGDLDLLDYLGEQAAEYLPALMGILDGFDETFAERPQAERHSLVQAFSETQQALFEGLLFHAYGCYYQDDRVLNAIGAGEGPPFPRGNEVEAGDLALLDPVTQLGKSYRRSS